jgi:exodeoxyribonuclease-3
MKNDDIKLVSWNVNGMTGVMKKGFLDAFKKLNADIFAVQETKLQSSKLTPEMNTIEGYESFWSHSILKKGYSGVGVYTKIRPNRIRYGIGVPKYDDEGRILELEFEDFIFFNVYFPNGQMSDERLQYKLDFYRDFFSYVEQYKNNGKSLIICGDYNTAHNEIDLKNPKANEKYSGFLRVERDWLDRIVSEGYVDVFRHLYPDTVKYSWWTYRFNARAKNVGWRIDYFFVTRDLIQRERIRDSRIHDSVTGSDHCPIEVVLAPEN